jgi:cyclophilin family peptidyl-prolyl cis-trans isomerase
MQRIKLAFLVVATAALSVPAFPLTSAGADSPPGKTRKVADRKVATPVKASTKDISKQWAELCARREKITKSLEELDAKFQSADGAGQKKIGQEFERLRTEFDTEIGPEMARLAPTIFEKDPTDAVAAQFLIGTAFEKQNYADAIAILNTLIKSGTAKPNVIEQILGMLLQENRFADVMSVADKLVEAKDVNPRLLVVDSMAHFYSNDFEQARKLTKRAATADPKTAAGAEGFAKTCDEYAGFWKQELAIRAKEAKTSDLPRVLLKTNKGDIVLELFENEAPNTVANFISLVEAKKYNGTKFHRVLPNFMAQGGDPNTLDDDPGNDGGGGPGYTIPCECYSEKARKHFQGSLSMAHAGKDSGGSQFFLTCVPTPHLNWAPGKKESNHTVFGRVVEGLDVVLALRQGDAEQGREADVIESARVLRKRDHKYVPVKSAGGKKAPAKKSNDDEVLE